MTDRYLSIAEAAVYYSVSTKTVRRWIAAGTLTAVRVGPRLIRVDVSAPGKLLRPVGVIRLESEESDG